MPFKLSWRGLPSRDKPTGKGIEERMLDRQIRLDQAEFDKAKWTVNSLISSYNSAKSMGLQDHIVETMKGYYANLPPQLRKAVDPYLAQGPTSETAEKQREFLKHNPPPKMPIIPGGADDIIANTARVNYLFKQSDWEKQRKGFLFGSANAPDKQNMLSFGDGSAALRNKDGRITFMSQADLKLDDMAEKYGVEKKDILLNGGIIPTGSKGVAIVNGRKITTEGTVNLFAEDPKEKYGMKVVGIEAAPKGSQFFEHPKELTKLLLDWKSTETDNETVKNIKDVAGNNPQLAQTMLTEIFPQYSFKIVERGKAPGFFNTLLNICPFLSGDSNLGLIPIRGRPTPFTDKSGKELIYYYDQSLDLVSNRMGVPMGNYEQVYTTTLTKDVETVK